MHLKNIFYKLMMVIGGKNSKGLELARKCGLNSAEVMDYIYRRVPTPIGNGFLGTWADSLFLEFPTWKSIRQRRKNIQYVLLNILKGRLEREPEREIKILDLASGYSQYVFSVLDMLEKGTDKIYVEMRDKNKVCEQHINSANKNGYNVKYVCADITNESDYDFNNKFDIIILAGFYDSIGMGETRTIDSTMKFICRTMNDDGLFIYSYQSSHVDSALVNELFTDTNSVPLSMGERPQIDVQYIMDNEGLKHIGQIADSESRYTVVVAGKASSNVDYVQKLLSVKKGE